jgi:hypothetical protein
LDIALNRQIVEFHKSRHIQLRHGRSILRYGETYYRWCFPDSTTARTVWRSAPHLLAIRRGGLR